MTMTILSFTPRGLWGVSARKASPGEIKTMGHSDLLKSDKELEKMCELDSSDASSSILSLSLSVNM